MTRIYLLILLVLTLFIPVLISLSASCIDESENEPITRIPLPGYPLTVKQGIQEYIVFKNNDASRVSSIYISRAIVMNGKITIEEYSLPYLFINKTHIKITIPMNISCGVYDLILALRGFNKTVPNGLWILCKTPPSSIRFLHQTDEHSMAGTNLRASAGILAQLLGAQMVIDTGDVTDKASSLEAIDYLETFTRYYGYLPLLVAPGNHDTGTRVFEEYIAPRVWFKRIYWLLIIALDSGERGYPSKMQLKFLENVLSENRETNVKLVLVHHPLFWYWGRLSLSSIDKNLERYLSYYWRPALDIARSFLRLVEDYNITMVLAGHIHRDMLVLYHSTRTNTTTLFLTTTTLSYSRPYCNGVHVVDISKTGDYDIPLTIITSKQESCNSISVDPSTDMHFYVKPIVTDKSIGLIIDNSLNISLSHPVLIRLPWYNKASSNLLFNYTVLYGNAYASLLDYKLRGNRLFLALNLTVQAKSGLKLVVASSRDKESPRIDLTGMYPHKPSYGSPLTLYFNVTDKGWGVENISVKIISVDGKPVKHSVKNLDGNIVVMIPSFNKPARLLIKAVDLAGNKAVFNMTITASETLNITEDNENKNTNKVFTDLYMLLLVFVLAVLLLVIGISVKKKIV